jgi:hypothetical protein
MPSAGVNMRNALMFSAPNPFDATVSFTPLPVTRSTWMTATGSLLIVRRAIGSPTTDVRR